MSMNGNMVLKYGIIVLNQHGIKGSP
jgi:hypothetical protein